MSGVADLNAALALALADLSEPHKTGKGDTGTYSYTYLTLSDLSATVRQAFAAHGLAFTQHVEVVDQGVEVTTRLVHSGGQTWTSGPLRMPASARNAQALGSAITYARRYQLAALVGLSGSDDDDAAAATHAPAGAEPSPEQPTRIGRAGARVGKRGSAPAGDPHPRTPAVPQGRQVFRTASDKQMGYLFKLLDRHGYNSDESRHAWASSVLEQPVTTFTDLDVSQVSRLIDTLAEPSQATRAKGTDVDDPWYLREPPADE